MTFIDSCWTFTETKPWMLARWGGGWHVSAVATATWKTSHVQDSRAQLSDHEMKSVSISSSMRIGGLQLGNCVQSCISASVRWKQWWQHWNIAKFAPGGSHKCSHRNIKNTVQVCPDLLNEYRAEGDSFLDHIITSDKTWCHHYKPESKWQSMEWRHVNSPSKKKFKMLPSVGKVMCTFFWDRKGVILLVFLEPRQTINSDLYIAMLTKLNARISGVRPEKKTTFLFQHDNARSHTSLKTVEHIVSLGWTFVPHPPYSPDLALSDFHLFGPMKDWLRGQHFPSYNAVIWAVKQWATSTGAYFYEHGMQALVHRWHKCIAIGGDYVKKQCFVAKNLLYQIVLLCSLYLL